MPLRRQTTVEAWALPNSQAGAGPIATGTLIIRTAVSNKPCAELADSRSPN